MKRSAAAEEEERRKEEERRELTEEEWEQVVQQVRLACPARSYVCCEHLRVYPESAPNSVASSTGLPRTQLRGSLLRAHLAPKRVLV
eukprot:3120878-Rhodomonas_salina.1